MVRRLLGSLFREVRTVHQAAYILALFTFGSQLLALVRDRLLAHEFGAGSQLDIYYAAFRIPDLLYVVFASLLSVYVLIPFVAERLTVSVAHARQLLESVLTVFVTGYGVLALGLFLLAPVVVQLFFPGFAADQQVQIVTLLSILLIQPIFLGLSSLLGVVTQINHRFALYAISPLLYNLGIIVGIIFLYPHFGLVGLVIGVVAGACAHLCIQFPFLWGDPLLPRRLVVPRWSELRPVFRLSVPRALTLSLHQLTLLGLVGLASVMIAGSVSVFQFAYNLQSVPLAIIGVSYSVAAFPFLARLYAEGKREQFSLEIMSALRHIIFWALPIIALLIVVRAQFVRAVLGSGSFDWDDTRLTAAVLALFALSLGAQACQLLLTRALYAIGNTRIPFFTTVASSVIAFVAASAFYLLIQSEPTLASGLAQLMRLQGVAGVEVLALPLGYSLAIIAQVIVMCYVARDHLGLRLGRLMKVVGRALVASLVAGGSAYVTLNVIASQLVADTVLVVLAQGLAAAVVGLVFALLTYWLVRAEELAEMYTALGRKFGKKGDVVAPQSEDQLSV